MKTLMTIVALAVASSVGLATGCAGVAPAVFQAAAVVFDSVSKGLQLINTIRMWLEQFGAVLAPPDAAALNQTLDDAERLLLEAQQLARQGEKTAEQAERTKDQGMALLKQAWSTLQGFGLARRDALIGGLGRDGAALELRVNLPDELQQQ